MNSKLLLAAVAAAVSLPAAAQAQRVPTAVIAVVDTGRIYRDCTACKSAVSQLQGQANSLQARRNTLAKSLQTEGTSVQTAINALAGKQPDAALQARIKAFQTKEDAANQELSRLQQNIQSSQVNVRRQIDQRLQPIINQQMTAKGANIVLDAEATLANANALDITNDVLAALNSAVPSVSVTPMPQQQQQQQSR